MESEGLIQRVDRYDAKGGQQSNFYSFDGLIEKMAPYALEALALKEKQKNEKSTFLKKKKAAAGEPKLRLVKDKGDNK
jgi:hypothetical protein